MSFQDALYTNDKVGAWYYGVNNNINAVIEPSTASVNKDDPSSAQAINLPGLNNLPNGNESTTNGWGNIPGLRGH